MGIIPAKIIGIGNEYRTDDGVGLFVARQIRELDMDDVTVIDGVSDGTKLLEEWKDMPFVVVIDCVVSGAEPGHVYSFDGLSARIPADYFTAYSTHALNISDSIELARVLGVLPQRLHIYGIEGKTFSPGKGLTPDVEKSARRLVECIMREIKKAGRREKSTHV
jgi:hydrogenase maturation protease